MFPSSPFTLTFCLYSLCHLLPSFRQAPFPRTGGVPPGRTALHGEVLAATRLTEASLSFFPGRHNNVEFLVLSRKSESLITFSY